MRWKDALIVAFASVLICYGLRILFIELGITELWDFIGRIATAVWVANLLLDMGFRNRQYIR